MVGYKMLNMIKRLIGNITVEEKNNSIYINGIPTYAMSRDIAKIWETERINSNLFEKIDRYSLIIPSFFALEFYYILNQMEEDNYKFRKQTNIRSIRRIKELLITNTWLKQTKEEFNYKFLNYNRLKELTLKPLDHQSRFFEQYEEHTKRFNLNGYMLAAAPGSGKTYAGLALSSLLDSDLVVVVCPKNAIYTVWEESLKDKFKKIPKYWIAADNKPFNDKTKFIIAHYESLERIIELIKKLPQPKNPLVFLDESHNLNEISSMRTQLFIELCKILNTKNVVWASGTPLKAMGGEMVPFLRSIDPLFTTDVEKRFLNIFGKNVQRANDILKHRLGFLSFKVEKHEYSKDNKEEKEIKIAIPNGSKYTLSAIREDMRAFIQERTIHYQAERKKYEKAFYDGLSYHEKNNIKSTDEKEKYNLYKEYLEEIIRRYDPALMKDKAIYCNNYEKKTIIPYLPKELKYTFDNARSVIKYVNLKIQGEALGRVLTRKRVECHLEMINYINIPEIVESSIKKTILFTSYVEVANKVEKYMKEEGFKPVVVHSFTKETLTEAVNKFDNNLDINPLIATFKSLSTAVPLVMANTVVMLNAPFRDYEYQQALSRVDRIGQDEKVFIINVFLDTGNEANISTRSKDILQWSKEQVASIMGIGVDDNIEVSVEALMGEPCIGIVNESILKTNLPPSLKW